MLVPLSAIYVNVPGSQSQCMTQAALDAEARTLTGQPTALPAGCVEVTPGAARRRDGGPLPGGGPAVRAGRGVHAARGAAAAVPARLLRVPAGGLLHAAADSPPPLLLLLQTSSAPAASTGSP